MRLVKVLVPSLISLFLFYACSEKKQKIIQYNSGSQILNINNVGVDGQYVESPKFEKIGPDSIAVGKELVVKIFAHDSSVKIVNAFLICKLNEKSTVDTVTFKVADCREALLVKADTIFIGFTPNDVIDTRFPEIEILTQDKDKVFRIFPYSFRYRVFSVSDSPTR